MIKILQNWHEIGEATLSLQHKRLPTHTSVLKNWDLFSLYNTLSAYRRDSIILDLGCGSGEALKLLLALGFQNIHGVDFQVGWKLRASQFRRMLRHRSLKPPFHLHKGDITKTRFSNQSFDCAVCISVIEHGVNLESFLKEAYRVLKPSGLLFLTTDYWEEKICIDNSIKAFGLPWKIFSRLEISNLITLAQDIGFVLNSTSEIPDCSERPVLWQNARYTFINLIFSKTDSSRTL
jgi:ubiquinone/menaquinone biosynthesis C-methylase UbiE